MPLTTHTIHIHAQAPRKPDPGMACNGCGVCCLVEPCPLGMLLSAKREGACDALRWSEVDAVYRCGAIMAPDAVVRAALPWADRRGLRWLWPLATAVLRRAAHRWVAAGQGCDSTLQPPSSPTITP
jgi:hypothetical protein